MLLNGKVAYFKRSDVSVLKRGAVQPKPTGAAIAAEARRFIGVQYLWGGTSGFGFDCSGFTYAVHRQLGVAIARDARPQTAGGKVIASRKDLRPGDIVFLQHSGVIEHCGIAVGGDAMIHAPRTGEAVRIVSLSKEPYASAFAGARRYGR